MSATPNVDRRIEAFVADGPTVAPDHLLGQTIRAVASERQARRPWWPPVFDRAGRRDAALLLVGACAAVVLAGTVLWRGGLIPPVPSPSDSPGASGSTSPSPSATTRVIDAPAVPTRTPAPSPATYTNQALGFSVDRGDLTAPPMIPGAGTIADTVLFPVRYLGADVFDYAFLVAAGDPEHGVWLVGDGARVRAPTLEKLESAFREHVPDASEATTIVVDGEAAKLLLVPQAGRGGVASTQLRSVSVPVVLVVHGTRPYVITWRRGLLGGQTDRQATLLAFMGRFQFVEPPAGLSASPAPSPLSSPRVSPASLCPGGCGTPHRR